MNRYRVFQTGRVALIAAVMSSVPAAERLESRALQAVKSSSVTEIVAVRRARTYGRGSGELRPPSDGQVVLVMTVRGVLDSAWTDNEIYLIAGTERIRATRRVRLNGVDERVVVFVVPASTTKFVLDVAGQTPQSFETKDPAVEHIMMR